MAVVLGRWIASWADRKQQAELRSYLLILESMDDDEIGLVVALASHQRIKIKEKYGWDLLFPAVVWLQDAGATMRIVSLVNSFKREKEPQNAGALMIWAHTMRAMSPSSSPELRSLGRRLWLELSRGFPFVEAQALTVFARMKMFVLYDGFDRYPDGLGPSGRTIVLGQDLL